VDERERNSSAGWDGGGVTWLNGEFRDPDEAVVSVFDHGFSVGDGVFETVLVRDGAPVALEPHLVRLAATTAVLGIDLGVGADDLVDVCSEAAARWTALGDGALGRLRITVTSGPGPAGAVRGPGPATVAVTCTAAPPVPASVAAVRVPWRVNERAPTAGMKTTSYADNVAVLAAVRAHGADEALLANTNDELCEATSANVFVVVDDELLTPSLSSGCLPGVTRALVLASGCGATEADLDEDVLDEATEVFLTSSLRGLQPVRSVDGRDLGTVPGPHTAAAVAAYDELLAGMG
jgi:branched-chain amino acid aminotransferase